VRWLWLACRLAQDLWDDELWYELATRGLRVARETGALRVLPIAATYRACLHVHAGAFGAASSLIEEADAIVEATGLAPLKLASLMLAAWRGNEAETLGCSRLGCPRREHGARAWRWGSPTGPRRCSTTAKPATPRRSRPPNEAASRTMSGSSRGTWWS
jgi:hypothetical protein